MIAESLVSQHVKAGPGPQAFDNACRGASTGRTCSPSPRSTYGRRQLEPEDHAGCISGAQEHPVVPGLCWRHSVCSSLVPWLIRRIKPVFIVLCWEELFRLLLLSSRMHGWQESERLLNIQTSRKPNANRDGPGKSIHDQPLAPKAVCLKINTAGRSGKMVTTKKTIKLVFKHRLFRPACFANTLTIMKPVNRGGHQHPTPASM